MRHSKDVRQLDWGLGYHKLQAAVVWNVRCEEGLGSEGDCEHTLCYRAEQRRPRTAPAWEM